MLFLCNEKTNIKKKLSRPRGTRDILFSQAFLFFQIQKKITQVLEKNNYYPVIFPTLEYEHLFRSNLENSEVGKEMYTFPDKKGRILALRPEGTLSVARVCYQNGLLTEGAVHKFYY